VVLLNSCLCSRRIRWRRRDRSYWLQRIELAVSAPAVTTARKHAAGLRRALRVHEHAEHLHCVAEEKRVCGDRNWIYGYKRGDKRVKAHCRKLSGPQKQSMEVAMQKQEVKKNQRELAALVRK
jgi:hypothetical protein